jgi:hypothetical protein
MQRSAPTVLHWECLGVRPALRACSALACGPCHSSLLTCCMACVNCDSWMTRACSLLMARMPPVLLPVLRYSHPVSDPAPGWTTKLLGCQGTFSSLITWSLYRISRWLMFLSISALSALLVSRSRCLDTWLRWGQMWPDSSVHSVCSQPACAPSWLAAPAGQNACL